MCGVDVAEPAGVGVGEGDKGVDDAFEEGLYAPFSAEIDGRQLDWESGAGAQVHADDVFCAAAQGEQ